MTTTVGQHYRSSDSCLSRPNLQSCHLANEIHIIARLLILICGETGVNRFSRTKKNVISKPDDTFTVFDIQTSLGMLPPVAVTLTYMTLL